MAHIKIHSGFISRSFYFLFNLSLVKRQEQPKNDNCSIVLPYNNFKRLKIKTILVNIDHYSNNRRWQMGVEFCQTINQYQVFIGYVNQLRNCFRCIQHNIPNPCLLKSVSIIFLESQNLQENLNLKFILLIVLQRSLFCIKTYPSLIHWVTKKNFTSAMEQWYSDIILFICLGI